LRTTYGRLVAFFLIACALSWFGLLGNWLLPSAAWPVPMNPLGPLLAALLVIAFSEGRAGLARWLRRIVRFAAPLWVYAVAFLVPLALIVAAVLLAKAVGTPSTALPARDFTEFLVLIPIILVLGPATEEPAFRGYGQHDLQQAISPLSASLLIGLGVLVWHAPLLVLGEIPPPLILTLIAVSVVYAWLYQMGGSVWPLVTLHFVQNYFGGEYFGLIFAPEDAWVWTGFLTAFYVLWAVLIVALFGPTLRRGRPPALDLATLRP